MSRRSNLFVYFIINAIGVASLSCKTTGEMTELDNFNRNYSYGVRDKRAFIPFVEAKSARKNLDFLRDQLKKDPHNFNLIINIAEYLYASGDLNGAEYYSSRALQIDFRATVPKILLAHIAFLRGHDQKAKGIIDVISEKNSNSVPSEVLNLAGCLALQRGDEAEAIQIFNKAIEKDSNNIGPSINLGLLFLRQQNPEEAEALFRDVLKKIPDNADIRMHLAISLAMQGELDEAKEHYQLISKKFQRNPIYIFNIAVLKRREGDLDGAIADLRKYLKSTRRSKQEEEVVYSLLADLQRQKNNTDDPGRTTGKSRRTRTDEDRERAAADYIMSGSVGAFQDGK